MYTHVRWCRVTVDNGPGLQPTIRGDLRAWGPEHTAALQTRFPARHWYVHGSPPFTEYSVANTTAKRPLEVRLKEADELVAVVFAIFRQLGDRALVLTLENPGTGKLVGRKVRGWQEGHACMHLY